MNLVAKAIETIIIEIGSEVGTIDENLSSIKGDGGKVLH